MLGKPDMPIQGGEGMRLTVAQAIRANTWCPAYAIGVEDRVGSLEVGSTLCPRRQVPSASSKTLPTPMNSTGDPP